MPKASYERNPFSLQLQLRHLFLPGTLALVFLLRWKLQMEWWGLALILLALPIYYFVIPKIVERKKRDFEREVLRLLQQGRRSELLACYRRQGFLRIFAPSGQIQKQLGFIYSEIGDFDRARACYARAAREAQAGDRLGILLGLAQARYRSGDFEGAEVVYRELLRRGQQLPEILLGLAHSLALRGRDLGEAFSLVTKAQAQIMGGALAAAAHLTLAEVLLARSKPGRARRALEQVELPAGDTWLEARRAWVRALMAINDGEPEEALEFFEEVLQLDPQGGLGDRARQQLAELEGSEEQKRVRLAG